MEGSLGDVGGLSEFNKTIVSIKLIQRRVENKSKINTLEPTNKLMVVSV